MNDSAFENEWTNEIVSNHQPPPCRGGDCPNQMHGRYLGPFSDGNEMGLTGWVAVAATTKQPKAQQGELLIDLSAIPLGKTISAVRYGAGSGGYNSTTGQYLARGLGQS